METEPLKVRQQSDLAGPALDERLGYGGGEPTLWQQFATTMTSGDYYQNWLTLQCRIIPDVSDAVLVLGPPERGPFAPAAFWPVRPRARRHLAEVAERVLSERHALVLPRDLPGSAGEPPHQRYHVAYPITVAERLHGVVALDIAPRAEPQLQEMMRQLHWGASWLELLWYRQDATQQETPERVHVAMQMLTSILEQERFQAAATAFATALATRLDCDRVSVGRVQRGHVTLQAVSHSAHFNKKSNLARALEAAMEEALDQERLVVYPPPPGSAFAITYAHAAFARQHGSGTLCSVPLPGAGSIVGILLLERPAASPFAPETLELCEVVAALAGPVLELRRRDDRWLLSKAVATLLQQLGYLFGPRHLARKLCALAVVAAAVLLATLQVPYRVTATTVLEPSLQRAMVAPFDGYIATAHVRAGDLVHAQDVLCRLDERELKLERLKWLSQREQYTKQYQQALAQRNAALVSIIAAQIAQAEAELALAEDRLARASVRAPFAGIVVSGDLSQAIGVPVERGKVLFEVAPLDAYRVMLQVDERDIGDIAVAQQGHVTLTAFPTLPLPVRITKMTPVSTTREGQNYFRVEAQLAETPAYLRPNMEGVSKIEVAQRLALWVWTRRLVDWARLTVWSWWPW